jgi:hypothetical protein
MSNLETFVVKVKGRQPRTAEERQGKVGDMTSRSVTIARVQMIFIALDCGTTMTLSQLILPTIRYTLS